MSYKYTLAHLTVLGCPPPEMIYIASIAGYDYVSPRFISMRNPGDVDYDLYKDKNLYNLTKTALKETGLSVHDIELARIYEGMDVNSYKPAMEIAAEFGAKSIISSIWTTNREFYIEKFAELCDTAKQYGLIVDLEFVTWSDVISLKEAKYILETVNRDNTGVLVDTLHVHRSRVAVDELDEIPEEWIHFVHLCDGPAEIPTDKESLIFTGRDARLYVGEGAIDIAAICNKLPKDIVMSLELPNVQRVKDYGYTEHARRCLVTAKDYFKNNFKK